MRFAYIAQGALWIQDVGQPARQIESRFVREAEERAAQNARVNAWKNAPRDEEQRGLVPSSMLWRTSGDPSQQPPARFEHVTAGPDDDTIYYVLNISRSTGLFRYHINENREVRLLHSADFRCDGLAYDRANNRLLLSRAGPDGRAHVQIFDTEGNAKGFLTGGDCVDSAPWAASNEPDRLYFQSAGLALHPQQGYVVATSNAVINRMEISTKQIQTIFESPELDYLAPRHDGRGNLFYITRPYELPYAAKPLDSVKDVLLFPWRLIRAVFGYLNFFSMIYGKEPLKSVGGPRSPHLEQDLGRLWLHGRMIELSKVQYKKAAGGGLVPASWKLMRCDAKGVEGRVATNVASFDVSATGRVLYTNGFEIYQFPDPVGKPIGHADLIESVVALS
jgi:hypothetical protein